LDYFKESYFQIILKLGYEFDYPTDELRKDFLLFVEKLMNSNMSFFYYPQEINFIKTILGRKVIIDRDQIANFSFINKDLSFGSFEKVLKYVDEHHMSFNAQECASTVGVTIYEVILAIVFLLVNEVLRNNQIVA